MTRARRAEADLELCQHEIERLRARVQTHLATIKQLRRRVRELERALLKRIT